MARRKYGFKAKSSPARQVEGQLTFDFDNTSQRRRIHEAVATDPTAVDDWDYAIFSSSRCERARYSPSRRELQMYWTNAPDGSPYPPYVYDAVPPAVWQGLTGAGSPGRYVNTTLNTYPYRPAPEMGWNPEAE